VIEYTGMIHLRWTYVLTCLWLGLPCAIQAQQLSLFEPVDIASTTQDPVEALPILAQPPLSPLPVLTGTSRIGQRFGGTFRDSAGNSVQVRWLAGESVGIPGFPGLRVLQIGAREVRLALPPGTPCLPAPEQGIRCEDEGTVLLGLTTAPPFALSVTQEGSVDSTPAATDPSDSAENPDLAPDNPFAAALRAAAEEQRNGASGRRGPFNVERFQPRRISPDDVPPGMRLVRTPFGDRLVEL
jgi:hypothetical protein